MDLSIQDQYHAISFPIYQTATFSRSRLGEESGFDYTRQSNPTRSQLESVMAGLENAEHAIAFSSGMAAISAVMNLFEPGDHIIVDADLYGGSMISFEVRSKDFAVSVLNNVELFYFAESLGGTETLITYPITQTHAAVPKELLDKNGINDRLLRLSVGIEGAEDLIGEIERVFKIAAKK
ncbi:MAG: PLP-dependent transferase [Lachnospiraceae bacterium]|nr:PLP-dependent transferase [Lachnospiraceae bacterium]